MKTEVEVKGAVRGSYVWGIANGRCFEVVELLEPSVYGRSSRYSGTYPDCDGPEMAMRYAFARCPRLLGRKVDVLRHLPGSKTGATFAESVYRGTVESCGCEA